MSVTSENLLNSEAPRLQWIKRVNTLMDQAEKWASEEDWACVRSERKITERLLGEYSVPALRIRLTAGEVHVLPIALNVVGSDGRIDIEAFPSLNRVKLIERGKGWEIYTDSNIPLRQPWSRETFARLVRDLLEE